MGIGKQRRRAALAGAVCLATVAMPTRSAHAGNYIWDPNATGDASPGGSGTWDTTSSFWYNGASDTSWPNLSTATAVFGGSAGTVTLGAPIIAGGLNFNTPAYTIAGNGSNTLSLSGTVALTGIGATPTTDSIISASLAGGGNINVVNNAPSALSALVLSGTNSGYTGTITVGGGAILSMSSAAAVPANIVGVSSANAIPVIGYTFNATTAQIPNVTGAAGSTGVIALTTNGTTNTAAINLATEGGGGWYLGSAGPAATNAGYTYTGVITPSPQGGGQYVYRLGGGGATTGDFGISNAASFGGTAANGIYNIVIGDDAIGGTGNVNLNRNIATFYNASATGASNGSVTINAGSQLLLFVGTTNAKNPNILPSNAPLIMNGGTFGTTGSGDSFAQTLNGLTLNAGAATVNTASAATYALTLGAIARNTGSTLDFNAPTATNTTTTTTANANFSGGQQTILGGYATVAGASWAVSGSGATAGTITALTYPATPVAFTSASAGTDVDAGAGTATPGSITINSLRFNGTGAGGSGASTIADTGAGDTLTIATGGILETAAMGTNAVTISTANLASGNGQDLIVIQNNTAANPAMTIDSIISGSNGLTKSGPGGLILGAANTFTGNTTINAGTLTLANSLALQNSTVSANVFGSSLNTAGGTLSFGALTSATLGGLSGNQSLSLTNTASSAVAMTVGGNGQSTTYGGNASGLGSLIKTGSGTLTLAGNSTYSGTTEISAGMLNITGSVAGGPLTVDTNATLSGTGMISAVVDVTSGGTIFPGTTIDAPGEVASTLTVGSGSSLLGTTLLDITGPDVNDKIIIGDGVTSSVSFGGTLTVNDPNSTAFAAGQTYDLFAFGTDPGDFSNINLPSLPSGLTWDTSDLYTTGAIGVDAVPEPASMLAVSAAAGLLLRRRRSHNS